MEELKKEIEFNAEMEKMKILREHGKFNSLHESYAVALEEWQEAKEALEEAGKYMDEVWKMTREDAKEAALSMYNMAYKSAICAAAECVQIAAVCKKAIESVDMME